MANTRKDKYHQVTLAPDAQRKILTVQKAFRELGIWPSASEVIEQAVRLATPAFAEILSIELDDPTPLNEQGRPVDDTDDQNLCWVAAGASRAAASKKRRSK